MTDFPITDDIIAIIREAVAKASPSPPLDFGHGTEAYANIQGDDDIITGDVAWLFPVQINDDIKGGGAITSKYNILMAVGTLSDLSDDAVALESQIADMRVLTKRIIVILDADDRIKEITNIKREAIYFTRDLTVTGYAMSMTIETEPEATDYCVV